jgi:hypothetical protein
MDDKLCTVINVEDFKTVYVYDTSDTSAKDDEIQNQKYVVVGFTGDNSYTGAHDDWWPSKYGSIDTYLPWMPPTATWSNSVYQAWMWKTTDGATKSPTRGWAWNEELSSS